MRVLVCGGRDYSDYDTVCKTLDEIINLPFEEAYTKVVIIHGMARGADALADKYAVNRYIPVESYPADWEKHGRAAGHVRNKQMLDEGKPDLVIAFPGGKGTANMVEQAQKAGIKVVQIQESHKLAASQ